MPSRSHSLLLLGLATLALAGCQSPPAAEAPASPVPAMTAAAPSAGGAASASPALAFVASARPGQRTTVSDPSFGGTVLVEIEAQYHSASNRTCRRFAVSRPTPPALRQTKFACFTAAGLELVDIY